MAHTKKMPASGFSGEKGSSGKAIATVKGEVLQTPRTYPTNHASVKTQGEQKRTEATGKYSNEQCFVAPQSLEYKCSNHI